MASSIRLTPTEDLFRRCLLDCRDANNLDLELRFTGGWVRDKLLGLQSHDIDVGLSTMTGWQFGQILQEYMRKRGSIYVNEATAKGIDSRIKDLHKIAANPEKSKHLETITTKMFGIDVDFVNLRKELYAEDSRNPQMEFGTPEEDALRRDACVNALFYNLDTQEVEDFTQRGLDDMEAKILRTPLEPYQTFKDDPLRVLRLIRFASRLGYSIEPRAYQAMRNQNIHSALNDKISRERVGVEVNKIMEGANPQQGLNYIYDRDLYPVVFGNPPVDVQRIPYAYELLQKIISTDSEASNGNLEFENHATFSADLLSETDSRTLWTLATYAPWFQFETRAVNAARDSIRATNSVTKILVDAMRNREHFQSMIHDAAVGSVTRSRVGTTLRSAGKGWRYFVLFSILSDAITSDFDVILPRYQPFMSFVREQGLQNAAQLKPIIDGNQIKQALGAKRTGPWLKDALNIVLEWQFANPHGTADQAIEMIASKSTQFDLG